MIWNVEEKAYVISVNKLVRNTEEKMRNGYRHAFGFYCQRN
jgi:hypothetical protein